VCASQVDSRKQSELALAAFDRWQRRHPAAGFPVAVMRKFLDDRASSLAALVAYYAFFSLFPLLLVLVSALGFVLQDNPSLQQDVLDSALARIPVIGAQLQDDVEPLTGSTSALAIGLAGALWAGLGVTLAFGRAFETIWDVPRLQQRGAVRARVRGLLILGVLGVSLIVATLVAGLAVGDRFGPAAEELGAVGAVLLVNLTTFLAFFALLTPRPPRLMELLPGAALAAAGSLALQTAGGWYVERAVAGASETYGVFALVIGLLSWFWLGAHLLLVAAEVNVVRHHRLWPRSLAGDLEVADRMALGRTAEAAQQDERQEIQVRFADDPESGPT
jgi:membrane protein